MTQTDDIMPKTNCPISHFDPLIWRPLKILPPKGEKL